MSYRRHYVVLAAVITALAISLAIDLYGVDKYFLLYYSDSAYHLSAARKLLDWPNPGIQQIGTVWLPLPHLLFLLPSLSDFLYYSGFAGAAINIPAISLATVVLYKLLLSTGKLDRTLALAIALLFPLNPNILYLAITGMTEILFMLFFISSAFYFQRWLAVGKTSSLLYCSAFIAAATLCRYESWPLALFLLVAVGIMTAKYRIKFPAILATMLSISGIAIWLAWNASIYGNPLEFADAQYYSAASQAQERPVRDTLYLQPLNVIAIYGVTALIVYGPALLWFAGRGFSKNVKMPLLWYLAIPAAFTPISMFFGIGEMSLWFNSRFIVLLTPLLVVSTLLYLQSANKLRRKAVIALVFAHILIVVPILHSVTYFDFLKDNHLIQLPLTAKVGGQEMRLDTSGTITLQDQSGSQHQYPIPKDTSLIGIVTLIDAKSIFSYGDNPSAIQVGEFLRSNYDNGKIMTLAGSGQGQRIMISSWIHLANYDEMEEYNTWKDSFKQPWKYDKWIVIAKSPEPDAVKTVQFWQGNRGLLDSHYDTKFQNEYYEVLKIKQP